MGSLAAPRMQLGFPHCKTEARIAGVWGQSTALVSAEPQRAVGKTGEAVGMAEDTSSGLVQTCS